mgnify:CR=1 FL=1
MMHLEFGVGTRVYTSDKQFNKLNNQEFLQEFLNVNSGKVEFFYYFTGIWLLI